MPTINEMIQFVGKECAELEAANLTLVSHKPTTNTIAQRRNSHNITANKPPWGQFSPRMIILTASSSNHNCTLSVPHLTTVHIYVMVFLI